MSLIKLFLAYVIIGSLLSGCKVTSHSVTPSNFGTTRSTDAMLQTLHQPGPLKVERIAATDWVVALSGLINLEHPKAIAANLTDREERIKIYAYAIRHPKQGLYLVDSGIEEAITTDGPEALLSGWIGSLAQKDKMDHHISTAQWLRDQPETLRGVFLTHLHLDHILGLPDIPKDTLIFTGPKEHLHRGMKNIVLQGVTNQALEGHQPLQELTFKPEQDSRFAGVIDAFGDGSFWILHVPGHTPGSLAFVARTPEGPVMITGDTCHTSWGWHNEVEPGGFTVDHGLNRKHLKELRKLAADYGMRVFLGHQEL